MKATLIALARSLRGLGLSYREVEADLAKQGVVGRTGQPLKLPTVHAIAK